MEKKLNQTKKAQAGMEFLIIVGAALFFFVLFLAAVQEGYLERSREEEKLFIEKLAFSIRDEIDIATKTIDGYKRNFLVPEKIAGKDYHIEIADNSVYIKTEQNAISIEIHNIEGELKKGENEIRKEDGTVYLNKA